MGIVLSVGIIRFRYAGLCCDQVIARAVSGPYYGDYTAVFKIVFLIINT